MVRMTRALACAIATCLMVSSALAQPALLPVPTPDVLGTPAPCCPTPLDETGQPLVYDRSLLYLPDKHPLTGRNFEVRPRDERATWGRAALYLGQTSGRNGQMPDWRAGIDGAVGVWWDEDRRRGAEAGSMYLANGSSTVAGSVLETRFFTSHANYRQNIGRVKNIKFDILTGYRFASIGEDLTIQNVHDNTGNQFHGGTIGVAGEYRQGPWSVDGRASVAFGANFSRRNGLSDRDYTTLPEVAFTFGREILEGSRLFVGYRLAYLDRVARPGTIGNRPARFDSQGVMIGLDWWF